MSCYKILVFVALPWSFCILTITVKGMGIARLIKKLIKISPIAWKILRDYGPVIKNWVNKNSKSINLVSEQVKKLSEGLKFQRKDWQTGMKARVLAVSDQLDTLTQIDPTPAEITQIEIWHDRIKKVSRATLLVQTQAAGKEKRKAQKRIEESINQLVNEVLGAYIRELDENADKVPDFTDSHQKTSQEKSWETNNTLLEYEEK